MPDVHAGNGCTIGTAMTITDKVVSNVVGVDIGCGMYMVDLNRGIGAYLEAREELIRTYKAQGRRKEIEEALKRLKWEKESRVPTVPEDLCWLEGGSPHEGIPGGHERDLHHLRE